MRALIIEDECNSIYLLHRAIKEVVDIYWVKTINHGAQVLDLFGAQAFDFVVVDYSGTSFDFDTKISVIKHDDIIITSECDPPNYTGSNFIRKDALVKFILEKAGGRCG